MKRLILANRFYWPDKPATGQLLTDLATGLAATGWDVTVVTSRAGTTDRPPYERDRGVQIRRVRTLVGSETSLVRKALAIVLFSVGAWLEIFRQSRRGTIVVIMTDPPLASFAFGFAARLRQARVVYWLQDLYPEVAAAVTGRRWLNVLKPGRNSSLANADLCIAISHTLEAVVNEAAPRAMTAVIENWAPSGVRITSRTNTDVQRFRHDHGWNSDFVVGYSGNLGRVHELDALLEAAALLRNVKNVRFVFIGTGPQRAVLETRVLAARLENIEFLDAVPRDLLSVSLAAIDLHLVTLRRGCEAYVYPSKFYGVVAAGRPMMFIGPPTYEMARAVVAGGFGVVANGESPADIATTIVGLMAHPEAVERMAKAAEDAAPAVLAEHGIERWRSLLDQLHACCENAAAVSEPRQ